MGCVAYAARAAKVDKARCYRLRESDSGFAEQWDAALEEATELLEAEAVRRARHGVRKPVYQGGILVGHVQEYSDTLLIFLLKAAKPEKYRDRYDIRHSGAADLEVAIAEAKARALGEDQRPALPPVQILPAEPEPGAE